MAQTTNKDKFNIVQTRLRTDNVSVAVAQAGNTTLLELFIDEIARIYVHVDVSDQTLDAFSILAKFHPDAAYDTIFSVAGDYTTPAGLLVGASGNLTALAAGTSGWFIMDTKGLSAMKITASSANVAGSTVSIYAGGVS